MITNLMF